MILLALVGIALAASLLSGGHLEGLARVSLRRSYLILIALGIQVLVFSRRWQTLIGGGLGIELLAPSWSLHASMSSELLSGALYSLSLLFLLIAVWLNWRVPGIAILGLGLLLNALVILANGGHMPASLRALQIAGIVDSKMSFEAARVTNSSLIEADTPLWFLGDVFALPAWLPLANIFSIGDVLIAAGAILFVVHHTRKPLHGQSCIQLNDELIERENGPTAP
ncbi:MAG: DUF5317 domain-containing protein [Chloroflexi bacterium]|nr:DUF5317 domain-containing protein [Chloroflexota bacterium]